MDIIRKQPAGLPIRPNLIDYQAERAGFSWAAARRSLDGLPGGRGLNIAHEAVDRHAAGPRRAASRCAGAASDGASAATSPTRSCATPPAASPTCWRSSASHAGDRVFVLAGRIPDAVRRRCSARSSIAAWSRPLFSAFGPEPIATRIDLGAGKVLVTTTSLYRRKVAVDPRRAAERCSTCCWCATTPATRCRPAPSTSQALLDAAARPTRSARPTRRIPALLHFTSGTTGTPKGALHVHEAVVAHHATGRIALDLHPDDVFWCTADPGWVTGTSYGIIAPLAHGVTHGGRRGRLRRRALVRDPRARARQRLVHRADRDPHADEGRRRAARAARASRALRFIASVGEPLNPEAVVWGVEAFGLPIHDNWWQTETGGIMIANYAALDIRPGSMGRPLPGIEAAIVRRTPDGGAVSRSTSPAVEGELALRAGWPSMFRGYLNDEERYRKCFAGDWYLTGDLARRDADGYFWFVGRADDVIKSSGHLIGPFEVESVADGAPCGRRGRRDRQARPGGRRDRQGLRRAEGRARARRGAAARTARLRAQAPRRGGRAEGNRLRRRACRRPAAARSCAGCSRRASSACPKATPRRWSRTS